ncbi:helix-turn-helix domain-containing protein [Porphyromonas asaccharolytica]|uniref:Helix-turn-helix domain protein n=1 Tax=Porphyromonas asaccharolytica (strain ATCC 25260 / DSM 20707 / BCRC 10618 / CCUG 7834 / JCM 6326 / LMG 13178 / VPI 4198 / B440) TaxID=879243 RepID=F4KP53_PORAD|nr:helix-turn-helix domain-containing protein [Porphyromonas asaccharolytica]AEE13582.1 helix-turn-helix domain protein [Porphyromonas asaccharolytica DSM 20707]EFR33997.1 DNA-binding helix-turn-helix protein [Porphyromonas asaccharolytica PR426713P-I]
MYTEEQYRYALARVEALLPRMEDETMSAPEEQELAIMSDVVASYEEEHYPLESLTLGELISYALKEQGKSQAELARELGISPSRVSDFVNDKSEPSLSLAGRICQALGLSAELVLGCATPTYA